MEFTPQVKFTGSLYNTIETIIYLKTVFTEYNMRRRLTNQAFVNYEGQHDNTLYMSLLLSESSL